MSRLFRVFADSESPSSSCNSLNYRHTGPCLQLTLKPVVVAGCQYGVVSTDLGVRGASRLLLWAIPLGHSLNCEFKLNSRTSSGGDSALFCELMAGQTARISCRSELQRCKRVFECFHSEALCLLCSLYVGEMLLVDVPPE